MAEFIKKFPCKTCGSPDGDAMADKRGKIYLSCKACGSNVRYQDRAAQAKIKAEVEAYGAETSEPESAEVPENIEPEQVPPKPVKTRGFLGFNL